MTGIGWLDVQGASGAPSWHIATKGAMTVKLVKSANNYSEQQKPSPSCGGMVIAVVISILADHPFHSSSSARLQFVKLTGVFVGSRLET